MPRHILVVGPGRCGLVSMTELLNRQAKTRVSQEDPPLLPWRRDPQFNPMAARFARLDQARRSAIVGDSAAFYLPYLDDAVAADPDVRVIGLKRPREEVVASFTRFMDDWHLLPTNHWSADPGVGWTQDPVWTQTFPQYDITDRVAGIRRYWDEYHLRLDEAVSKHPQNVRVFDMHTTLNTEAGQREVLAFAGYPAELQVIAEGIRSVRSKPKPGRFAGKRSNNPLDPGRCVILVPFSGFIHQQCDNALRELERRGYQVRRVGGYAAIDQGRNQMATDALIDGFEETMWIDSDVDFNPDAIEQLRGHGLPMVSGIYAQKGRRALASHIIPGTSKMVFGQGGGPIEILYAATGFLLVRREVYLRVQLRLGLAVANERFGSPTIPFFQPKMFQIQDGYWYLAEDYAFSERVRSVGFKVVADTSIRLWHVGGYSYGWEDAGTDRERTGSFTLNFPDKLPDDGT
jgi:hypothetical protein